MYRHDCPGCGTVIYRRSEMCKDCRIAKWDRARAERFRRLSKLWKAGLSLVDIAAEMNTTPSAVSVQLDAAKHAGWPIVPRRKGWKGTNGGGPPLRPIRTKVQANNRLGHAIRHGKVVRPDACERCGAKGNVEGHHHDYSKPLDVEWLCRPCHAAHHWNERKAAA